jgi:hypothetical protein
MIDGSWIHAVHESLAEEEHKRVCRYLATCIRKRVAGCTGIISAYNPHKGQQPYQAGEVIRMGPTSTRQFGNPRLNSEARTSLHRQVSIWLCANVPTGL